jgi:transposase
VKLLRAVPGIGEILAPLVWLEVGDIERFPRAESLASYAGLVPRIIASGGRIRHGGTCRNVNQELKRGFVEAATCSLRLRAYPTPTSNAWRRPRPRRGRRRAAPGRARVLGAPDSRRGLTALDVRRPPQTL